MTRGQTMMNDPTSAELEMKKIAAELTISMLDNHSADWDDDAVAKAFRTIYAAVRTA
jgi:hypothetical protein